MDANQLAERTPRVGSEDALRIVEDLWGVAGEVTELPSERDRNFLIETGAGRRVLKVARRGEDRALLEAQNAMVARLAEAVRRYRFPVVVPSRAGRAIEEVAIGETSHQARLVEWVPGIPLAELPLGDRPPALLRELGRLMGAMDRALAGLELPALDRSFYWDPAGGARLVAEHLGAVPEARRGLVERRVELARRVVEPRLDRIRRQLIHADANDWNVIVDPDAPGGPRVTGLLDFGDAVRSWLPAEPAIAAAYAMLETDDPAGVACEVVAGYQAEYPLSRPELEAVWPLIGLRLAMSVTIGAIQRAERPDDAYLTVSQAGAWSLLERIDSLDADRATERIMESSGPESISELLERRAARIGPSLSISYRRPLHIVRGWKQHLYDADGREYLDCVNNVAHVGHAHPGVVDALARQAAVLNTNTRYLHEKLLALAERLTATLPAPLEVCYFVNSGSEATELALRLARAATGRRDAVVLDAAYHGNTSAAVDLSPYKFDGPGGGGAPDWVHVAPLPDPYRGRYRASDAEIAAAARAPSGRDAARDRPGPPDHPADAELAQRYARDVAAAAAEAEPNGGVAAFFAESLASCGGQIVYPDGFLSAAYAAIRDAGGVCVADEVQVGFGRVGRRFWGFETQDAVPDIVTMGKPMGNGHPVGAVVTTREIAAAFDNGMEYFNTFGGNPVSCAVGLAVLDIIDDEGLQAHAARVGDRLLAGLRELAGRHAAIGHVRGQGLFVGAELVTDRRERTPATRLAKAAVEAMRERRILLSTDGPDANVIKIKPPLPFDDADADRVVEELDEVLAEVAG